MEGLDAAPLKLMGVLLLTSIGIGSNPNHMGECCIHLGLMEKMCRHVKYLAVTIIYYCCQ